MSKRKRSNKKISGFGSLKKESQSKSIQNLRNNQLKEIEAMSCIQKGNINEAEKIYLELIERETQSHIVYGNLAAIYQMKGNKEKEQIIYLLKKALQIKPDFAQAHNNLGTALKEKGALNSAILSFQTALKIKPDFEKAHYNLGTALQENGDLNSAILSFQKALQIKPDFADAHYNLGHAIFLVGDDYKKAWPQYEYRFKLSKKNLFF